MKKKTHEEYVAQLAVKNPNVEVIGKYIDIKSKILHKCRIDGYEWSIRPLNALKGYGCPICSGNIKKSHTDYIEELSEINSNIKVIGKYKNAKTAILHKCKIDGYEWNAKPNNILNGKGCPKCAGNIKKAHEDYVEELSVINPNIKVIDKYINAYTPIIHTCIKHNVKWKVSPTNILCGKGCYKCKNEKIEIKLRKTHKQYINELKEINPNIICLDTYINSNIPILHKCLLDDYEWYAIPGNILFGSGCPKCAGNIKKAHEDYVEEAFKINPDIKIIDQYINSKTPILHKCLIDNYEWKVSPTEILSGSGCPQCHESSGERRVRQWLQKQNIQFEFQKRYHDCRDKNTLPFDFYLPTYNSIIEYDDKQHFEPIEHFGGKEKFKLTVKHDDIKNEYCKKNNISILRIPYYKNVEEELNNFLFI